MSSEVSVTAQSNEIQQLPFVSTYDASNEEIARATEVAQQILRLEGESASQELREMVERLRLTGNVEDLEHLEVCLQYIKTQIPSATPLTNRIWKLFKIDSDGSSPLKIMTLPILSHMKDKSLPSLIELSEESDVLEHWVRFTFSNFLVNDLVISPVTLKAFLMSPLGNSFIFGYDSRRNGINITSFNHRFLKLSVINGSICSFSPYYDGLRNLFKDEELLTLCINFSKERPEAVTALMEWAGTHPTNLKDLLLRVGQIDGLGGLLQFWPINLPKLQMLLDSPAADQIPLLEPLFDRYFIHSDLINTLLLYEQSEPNIENGATLQFLNTPISAIALLDLIQCFYRKESLHFENVTQLQTLYRLHQSHGILASKLFEKMISLHPKLMNVFLNRLGEIMDSDPGILHKILSKPSQQVYLCYLGGFFNKGPIDLLRLQEVLNWGDLHSNLMTLISSKIMVCDRWKERKHIGNSIYHGIKQDPDNVAYLLNKHSCNWKYFLSLLQSNATGSSSNSEIDLNEKIRNLALPKNVINGYTFLLIYEMKEIVENLLILRETDPFLADKFLDLATLEKKIRFVGKILSQYNQEPESNLCKLYRTLLLNNDVGALESLIQFRESHADEEVIPKLAQWVALLPEETSKDIFALIYGTSTIIQPIASSSSIQVIDISETIQRKMELCKANSILTDVHQRLSALYVVEEIVDQLLSKEGHLLLDRIDSLMEAARNITQVSEVYIRQILRVLFNLKTSSKLHHQLDMLKLETSCPPHAVLMIRASAGLPHDEEVKPKDLKKIALMTLMLHTRQLSNQGTCVGSSQLNALLAKPEEAMLPITQLLCQGELRGTFEERPVVLKFSPRLNEKRLHEQVNMSHDGMTFVNGVISNVSIAELSGVVKLSQYLNIPHDCIEKWIKSTLKELTSSLIHVSHIQMRTTHKEMVEALVRAARDNFSVLAQENFDELLDRCEVVYLSAFDNPLSRILEGLYLSADQKFKFMQNFRFKDIFMLMKTCSKSEQLKRMKHNEGVDLWVRQNALGPDVPCSIPVKLIEAVDEVPEMLWDSFQALFLDELDKGLSLIYDPNAGESGRNIFIDGNKCYEATPIAIDTSDKFIGLIVQILDKALEKWISESTSEIRLDTVSQELKAYLQSSYFLNTYTLLYSGYPEDMTPIQLNDPSFVAHFSPLEHEQFYPLLPWKTLDGADPKNSMLMMNAVGMHNKRNFSLIQYKCEKGSDVLKFMLGLFKYMNVSNNVNQYLAASVPGHSINFFFNDKRLRSLIEAEKKKEWLHENCVQPAIEFRDSHIFTEEDYKEICSKFSHQLKAPLSSRWDSLTKDIPQNLKLGELIRFLYEKLAHTLGSNDRKAHRLFADLDTVLTEQISAEKISTLPFLPFMDTNWYDESTHKDIYWGLWYSPVTKKWELWQSFDDSEFTKVTDEFFSQNDLYEVYFETS